MLQDHANILETDCGPSRRPEIPKFSGSSPFLFGNRHARHTQLPPISSQPSPVINYQLTWNMVVAVTHVRSSSVTNRVQDVTPNSLIEIQAGSNEITGSIQITPCFTRKSV